MNAWKEAFDAVAAVTLPGAEVDVGRVIGEWRRRLDGGAFEELRARAARFHVEPRQWEHGPIGGGLHQAAAPRGQRGRREWPQ